MVQPDPQPPQTPPKGSGDQGGKYGSDKDLWHYLGMGTQLTGTVGAFVLLGWWLDRKFGWTPWGLAVTASIGVAAAMYKFLKDAM